MERTALPNSTASLVLGISSIVLGICCYGVIGFILGIIAIVLGKQAEKIYKQDPEVYNGIGNAKAGFITGIIGVILSLAYVAFLIWIFSLIGWDALTDPELMQQRIEEVL